MTTRAGPGAVKCAGWPTPGHGEGGGRAALRGHLAEALERAASLCTAVCRSCVALTYDSVSLSPPLLPPPRPRPPNLCFPPPSPLLLSASCSLCLSCNLAPAACGAAAEPTLPSLQVNQPHSPLPPPSPPPSLPPPPSPLPALSPISPSLPPSIPPSLPHPSASPFSRSAPSPSLTFSCITPSLRFPSSLLPSQPSFPFPSSPPSPGLSTRSLTPHPRAHAPFPSQTPAAQLRPELAGLHASELAVASGLQSFGPPRRRRRVCHPRSRAGP